MLCGSDLPTCVVFLSSDFFSVFQNRVKLILARGKMGACSASDVPPMSVLEPSCASNRLLLEVLKIQE